MNRFFRSAALDGSYHGKEVFRHVCRVLPPHLLARYRLVPLSARGLLSICPCAWRGPNEQGSFFFSLVIVIRINRITSIAVGKDGERDTLR